MKKVIVGILSTISNINIACWLVVLDSYKKTIQDIANMNLFSFLPMILGILFTKTFLSSMKVNELFFIGLLLGGLPQITQQIKIKRVDLSHLVVFIIAFVLNLTIYQYSLVNEIPNFLLGIVYTLFFLLPGLNEIHFHMDIFFVLSFILSLWLFSQILKRIFNQFKNHVFCVILGLIIAILLILFIRVFSQGITSMDYLLFVIGCLLSFKIGGRKAW